MQKPHLFLFLILLASLLTGCVGDGMAQSEDAAPTSVPAKAESTVVSNVVSKDLPKDCPLTVPQDPVFTPPALYDTLDGFKDHFWFGSASLWTSVPASGVWNGLPHNSGGYTQKIFWWRDGYNSNEEPEPQLIVTGERLDAQAPPLKASRATNASASDIGSAMLVGVDFPTSGCWKVTGEYGDTELSFVVWVVP